MLIKLQASHPYQLEDIKYLLDLKVLPSGEDFGVAFVQKGQHDCNDTAQNNEYRRISVSLIKPSVGGLKP